MRQATDWTSPSSTRGDQPRAARRDQAGADPPRLDRDAVEPDLDRHGHCRGRPLRPRCGALLAVDSTVPTPVLHSTHCARRRHRAAFGDQVSQRTLRRRRWRDGVRPHGPVLYESAGRLRRTLGADPRLIRGRVSCCGVCAPCTCACAINRPRPWRSPSISPHPAIARVLYPGSSRIQVTPSQQPRCRAGSAGCCRCGSAVARLPPSPAPGACRSGNGPRRSAASRAWSSIARASKARAVHALSTCSDFSVRLECVDDLIADIEQSLPCADGGAHRQLGGKDTRLVIGVTNVEAPTKRRKQRWNGTLRFSSHPVLTTVLAEALTEEVPRCADERPGPCRRDQLNRPPFCGNRAELVAIPC